MTTCLRSVLSNGTSSPHNRHLRFDDSNNDSLVDCTCRQLHPPMSNSSSLDRPVLTNGDLGHHDVPVPPFSQMETLVLDNHVPSYQASHNGTTLHEGSPLKSLHRPLASSQSQKIRTYRKQLRKDFFSNATLHGVNEIQNSKSKSLKTFWIVAFLVALTASIYGCFAIVSEYVRSPVVVSYMVSDHSDIELPDLIICPFNRFNRTFLAKYKASREVAQYMELAVPSGEPLKFIRQVQNYSDYDYWENEVAKVLERANMTLLGFMSNGALTCEGLIRKCGLFAGNQRCCETAEDMWTSAGKCYRLIGGPQLSAGYGFGWSVLINLNKEVFTPARNQFHADGIVVKMAARNKGADVDFTFASKSTHTLLSLRETKYEFKNDPPRYECNDVDSNYSRVTCFDSCLFSSHQEMCNCTFIVMQRPGVDICTTRQMGEYYIFREKINHCRSSCKSPCDYTQYSATISSAQFPSETMKEFVTNETFESYKDSILLEVFFERLEYTTIKHIGAMTANGMIANLGGQIGLWVGGSILTMLQVIVFTFQYMIGRVSLKGIPKRERNRTVRALRSDTMPRSASDMNRSYSDADVTISDFGSRDDDLAKHSEPHFERLFSDPSIQDHNDMDNSVKSAGMNENTIFKDNNLLESTI